MRRLGAAAAIAAVTGLLAASAPAAGGYGPARVACLLSDPRITESSGVASASWADGVIWTHNDSGDEPRFYAVNTGTCTVMAVYDVTGAQAVDWEDMTRSGTSLHFGDIGDNDARRASVTVYDVPEPAQGALRVRSVPPPPGRSPTRTAPTTPSRSSSTPPPAASPSPRRSRRARRGCIWPRRPAAA